MQWVSWCINDVFWTSAEFHNGISKNKVVNLLQKADLNEKDLNTINEKKYKKIYSIYKNALKSYKVWWYWNWKTRTSPTQKP